MTMSMNAMARPPVHDFAPWKASARQGHRPSYRLDYAQVLKELSDTHFQTQRKSAWCRTISTLTNRRHSTKPFPPPKHAGWSKGSSGTIRPNMAAGWIWLNPNWAFCSSQCLGRRIPDKQTLIVEVAAWEKDRNKRHTKADWQFTTLTPASN